MHFRDDFCPKVRFSNFLDSVTLPFLPGGRNECCWVWRCKQDSLMLVLSSQALSKFVRRPFEKEPLFCLFGGDSILQIHSRSIEIFIRLSPFTFTPRFLQIIKTFKAVTAKGERRIEFTYYASVAQKWAWWGMRGCEIWRDGMTVWRFKTVKYQEWRFLLYAEIQHITRETVKPSQNNQSGWPDSIWRNEQNSPEYDSGTTDEEGPGWHGGELPRKRGIIFFPTADHYVCREINETRNRHGMPDNCQEEE